MDDSPVRSVKIDINVPDITKSEGATCTVTGISADVLSVLTTTIYRVASKVGITVPEMKEIISKILDDCDSVSAEA